jgi:uncharacterized protein YbaR (Trm112 family)
MIRFDCDCDRETHCDDMDDVTPQHLPRGHSKLECPDCGRWYEVDHHAGTWEVDA